MAKPNYSFEKRQRELAKKKKKEEKAAKKAAGGEGDEAMNPNQAAMALLRSRDGSSDEPTEASEDVSTDAAGQAGQAG